LHLTGIDETPERLAEVRRRSAARCSSANFWQDLSVDTTRGRLYVPRTDRERHGVDGHALLARQDGPACTRWLPSWSAGPARECSRRRPRAPSPRPRRLGAAAGGARGLRILDKIEAMDHATLARAPRLHARDLPRMLWRATLHAPSLAPLAPRTR
jgi:phytoene/squalene synthetase